MLEVDGIPPKLTSQFCEELLCQQYCYRGQLQQDVDVLLLKVNGRWHQLYFDSGIFFWRLQNVAPELVNVQPGDPLTYPLISLGEKYALKQAVMTKCITEPQPDGARVSFVFKAKGTVIVTHSDSTTSLRFIKKLPEIRL